MSTFAKASYHLVIRQSNVKTTFLSTFACYFLGEKPHFLAVNIRPDAYVEELLQAIHLNLEFDGKKANINDLHFFKASLFLI